MPLSEREKNEIARMVNDSLDNQFAFFTRPVVLKHLDAKAGTVPDWLRNKTVGEVIDAYKELRARKRIT